MSPDRLIITSHPIPEETLTELVYWQQIDPSARVEWRPDKKGTVIPVIAKSVIRKEMEANGIILAMHSQDKHGNPVIQIKLPF